MLGRVPAQVRDKVSGIRQAELAWRPRESAEILGRHFVSNVSQDGVVELDDRHRVLGGKTRSGPLLALGVNSGTELTTQTGLNELHQGLTGKWEGWGSTGQQPTCSLVELETHSRTGGRRQHTVYISDSESFWLMRPYNEGGSPCKTLSQVES